MTTTGSPKVEPPGDPAPRMILGIPRDLDRWHRSSPAAATARYGRRFLLGFGASYAQRAGCPKRLLGEKLRPSDPELGILLTIVNVRGASALICGPPGVGKTALSVMAVRRFLEHGGALWVCYEDDAPDEVYYQPPSVIFATAAELYEAVFRHDDALFDRATAAALLVIDDWGAQYEHEWPMARLDRLVDERYAELRRTIVTTNLHPTDHAYSFQALYPRAYSRLLATGPGLYVMTGPDRRLEGRT